MGETAPDAGREADARGITSEDITSDDITGWLRRWHGGDGEAFPRLVEAVYPHLRKIAVRAMRGERPDHTLQPTALLHETYLRLSRTGSPDWRDRVHFYAVAARTMRRILVDHARRPSARRRGGGRSERSRAGRNEPGVERPLLELLALDEALEALSRTDERKTRVIELRFFAGLDVEETAQALEVSKPTVVLDTRLAKEWLYARMRHREAVPRGGGPDS